ncbi:MAG TPA: PaaI family thioesterase [Acidimicrobiia bacterium]
MSQTGAPSTFIEAMGMVIEEVTAESVVGALTIDDRHLQPMGLVHGGVYAALAETLASYGATQWAIDHGSFGAVGLSNTTDFIRATRSGTLRAEATPLHQGRNQHLWQVVTTRSEDGKVSALTRVRLQIVHDPTTLGG